MKTRINFISNSSSASFVLTVDLSKKKLLESLFGECFFSYFNKDSFLKRLKSNLIKIENRLKEYKKPDEELEGLTELWKEQDKYRLEETKKLIEEVEKIDSENADLVEKILKYGEKEEYNGLGIEEKNGKTEVSGWTSMYNSVEDTGYPMMLIISVLADLNVPFKFKHIEDY